MYFTDNPTVNAVVISILSAISAIACLPGVALLLHWLGYDKLSAMAFMAWFHIITLGTHF